MARSRWRYSEGLCKESILVVLGFVLVAWVHTGSFESRGKDAVGS